MTPLDEMLDAIQLDNPFLDMLRDHCLYDGGLEELRVFSRCGRMCVHQWVYSPINVGNIATFLPLIRADVGPCAPPLGQF